MTAAAVVCDPIVSLALAKLKKKILLFVNWIKVELRFFVLQKMRQQQPCRTLGLCYWPALSAVLSVALQPSVSQNQYLCPSVQPCDTYKLFWPSFTLCDVRRGIKCELLVESHEYRASRLAPN